MRLKINAELDYDLPQPADVLLAIEAAPLPDQILVRDKLVVGTSTPLTPVAGHQDIGRRTWTAGQGRFTARYEAVVDVDRAPADLSRLGTVPLRRLPGDAIDYLWPSHYCPTDPMKGFAAETFGGLSGGARVAAIADWTRGSLDYVPGCSDATTTAHDSFQEKKGICRDFAHVMISLTRSLDIPARMVSAYAWDLDPPDFHAVAEVFLESESGEGGWYLVDPSGLAPVEGLVRIAVGRDAADVAFMTIFGGGATLNRQSVRVQKA